MSICTSYPGFDCEDRFMAAGVCSSSVESLVTCPAGNDCTGLESPLLRVRFDQVSCSAALPPPITENAVTMRSSSACAQLPVSLQVRCPTALLPVLHFGFGFRARAFHFLVHPLRIHSVFGVTEPGPEARAGVTRNSWRN